jgi:redox-sensitive bicupin YhaK (pirin superfamily)
MTRERTLDDVFSLQPFDNGRGFSGFGLRDPKLHVVMDPFLSVDHFRMSAPTFPPHPHAGFSAVTYLFADSETSFINRDSLGHVLDILPGAVHWTQAAGGVMHEEYPRDPGKQAHGLQIFVNLAAPQKHAAPSVKHAAATDIPAFDLAGASATVPFGSYLGHASSLQPDSHATLVDIELTAGASVRLPLPARANAFLLVIEGELTAATATSTVVLSPSVAGSIGALAEDGLLTVMSGPVTTRVALFLGTPLHEPIVMGGPFVMNTDQEITQAKRDFAAGRMGRLAPSA